jgi:phosphoserine phosphatase RsbU/P
MEREVVITFPDGKTKSVILNKPRWTLGRSGENDLGYADDSGLSRQHLAMELDGEDWFISDLGSKNGTYLNGSLLQGKQRLNPGDRITVSRLLLVYAGSKESVPECSIIFDQSQSDFLSSRTLSTSLDRLMAGRNEASEPVRGRPVEQRNKALDAFLRAGRELSQGRPLPDLFRVILDLSIEAVGAERGVLLTLENAHLIVQASRGDGFRISTTVRDRVLQEKASILLADVEDDEAFRSMQSIVSQSVRSLMAAPLQTDDQVIGLIYVDSSRLIHEFNSDNLDLLTVMANVAAIRIERERLAEIEQARRRLANELDQAAEIQRQFLPTRSPQVPGLDLAGYNASCRTVGGDYYDFVTYPDGRVALIVGDVCGKGMPAALLMMGLQARVQVLAEDPSDPAGMVERLNRVLTNASLNNRFITFFFSVLDPATGSMVYCNAGHNPPLLVRADGATKWLDGGGPVLGILPGITYQEHCCKVDTGDVVLLFSDGVTEACNPQDEEFGEQRLVQLLQPIRQQSAQTILDCLTKAVKDWLAGAPAADDITLVVARRVENTP